MLGKITFFIYMKSQLNENPIINFNFFFLGNMSKFLNDNEKKNIINLEHLHRKVNMGEEPLSNTIKGTECQLETRSPMAHIDA